MSVATCTETQLQAAILLQQVYMRFHAEPRSLGIHKLWPKDPKPQSSVEKDKALDLRTLKFLYKVEGSENSALV